MLMEVLFFVFDKTVPYQKKLILPKAIKVGQKYNCCCEGTFLTSVFMWNKDQNPNYCNFFAKWEA